MKTVSVDTPLLKNKHAVIFGAGGAIGTAVAKEFAAQGATVFSRVVHSTLLSRWLLRFTKKAALPMPRRWTPLMSRQ
jgi:NAD(P)-dependent dehydrogenase (short-subunit alcohol dehydrogenase family)